MRLLKLGPYIAGTLASAALLAGCSAGGSQSSALGPTALNPVPQGAYANHKVSLNDLHLTPFPFKKAQPEHRKSWMSPAAKLLPRQLYISDNSADTVTVYAMPDVTKVLGQVTGLNGPLGLCSDKAGNVWEVDSGSLTLNQYNFRTNGTTPLQTLTVPGGEIALACAVNHVNGDLAVVEFSFFGDTGVLIYPGATEPPNQTVSSVSLFSTPEFDGFDNLGNLFLSGIDLGGRYILAEATAPLPSGGGYGLFTQETITGGALFFPGDIQWDRTTGLLVLGDQRCNDVNATTCLNSADVTTTPGTANIKQQTLLSDSQGRALCDMVEFDIGPQARMGAAGSSYNFCNGDPNSVDRWHFPAGGIPTNTTTNGPVLTPVGAALSVK